LAQGSGFQAFLSHSTLACGGAREV
jgi:hypothetical protein